MDGKKDPGKFTVRFNLCDPQQRQAAELLNQQGRSKAQFIANAILNYAAGQAPMPQGTPTVDNEQIRKIVEDIFVQRGMQTSGMSAVPDVNSDQQNLRSTERDAIFRTLDAFRKQ